MILVWNNVQSFKIDYFHFTGTKNSLQGQFLGKQD